ncbi:hypothetical protein [Burkholderia ubonensis]|uniref:hypothetical protein n=1 Tax=Burkholderia ubonensis TaxID=101571 RepID=UPI000AA138DB|nr:hypothetical protein [Burkholderia ubonensis]
MLNHGHVDLQLTVYAMNRLLSVGLVQSAGPTYGSPSIWDAMVSDLEWESLRKTLDRAGEPYKAADPSGSGLVAYNGADW